MDKPKLLISLHPISQPKMAPDTFDAITASLTKTQIRAALSRQPFLLLITSLAGRTRIQ